MRGVEASIDLKGLGISSKYTERRCIMFTDPAIYIHGTRAEMREFARQIAEKAAPPPQTGRVFIGTPEGVAIKEVTLDGV